MSDEAKTDPAATPAVDPKFTIKFDGKEVSYDISKPEDRARLKNDAELGRFHEKQTAKVTEMQARLKQLEEDPALKIGRGLQGYMQEDPLGASALTETYKALQERRVDPNRVRAALVGQDGGDAASLEAQARASGDPQARALLHQMAAQLRGVQDQTNALSLAQARREQDAAIRGTLAAEDWLRSRPTAMQFAERRARELAAGGNVSLEEASLLAVRETRELVNEAANSEAERLRDQKKESPMKTSAGLPPLGEYLGKKVDPKAKAPERALQRVTALKDRFRAMLSNTIEGQSQ